MNKPNQVREALFASNFLPLAKFHLEQWMLQQSPSTRANLKIALRSLDKPKVSNSGWSAKSLLEMCEWEHEHYNNLKHVHQEI